jgi:hypothetical protein
VDLRAEDEEEEETAPRVGDSDLEWGSAGPGEEEGDGNDVDETRGTAKERKHRRKAQRTERREGERMARLSLSARVQVETTLLAATTGSRSTRGRAMDQAAEDYASNIMRSTTSDDDDGMDLDAARSFAEGLMGAESGVQKTLAELADEARAREEEDEEGGGWRTTSGSESSEGSDDEVDSDDLLEADVALGEADAE